MPRTANNNFLRGFFVTTLALLLANVEIFLLGFSFYVLFNSAYVIINEEILLCVCFIIFLLTIFCSLNNSLVLENLQEKTEGIKAVLFISGGFKLKKLSKKNALITPNNCAEKPACITRLLLKTLSLESTIGCQKIQNAQRRALIFRLNGCFSKSNKDIEKSKAFYSLAACFFNNTVYGPLIFCDVPLALRDGQDYDD